MVNFFLGVSKRKARKKPTVTSLMPNRTHLTNDARVHLNATAGVVPSPLYQSMNLGRRGALFGQNYHVSSVRYVNRDDSRPPVYSAYVQGDKLIEVYCPTVGRGFNPRYNSLLIEPDVQLFLPRITGVSTSMSEAMEDLYTFHRIATEFTIPPINIVD